ncbi:hypothetical protein K437DRAFT_135739 [Tilletiaria anomala UBC 951]|uniref:SRP54-type proteins GTP-binding domain-containing protein n=1 Tax=Tilletiaria anomala (strain ATCC 24038 / CBS 436.72 / UBC 951) TaxID=1037660 RepID=A0A066WGU3_TILAU|nr:uncharacterized protein K437DRAFT_135739 [Tilletiaria anomala UBC 951]KDN53026.1 hypothetical protein K437DRAFT_135739 [Tilletiaria anomala UBC 951]
MLDHFTIFTRTGVVLWSKSFTPTVADDLDKPSNPIDSLIRETFVEERTADRKYEKDGYTIRWSFANDLELIYVVVYQRILQLSYIDDLLDQVKSAFVQLFESFLRALLQVARGDASGLSSTLAKDPSSGNGIAPALAPQLRLNFANKLKAEWEATFLLILRSLERTASAADKANRRALGVDTPLGEKKGMQGANLFSCEHSNANSTAGRETTGGTSTPAGKEADGTEASEIAKNVAALKARLKAAESSGGAGRRTASGGGGPGNKKGKKGGGKDSPAGAGSGVESPAAGSSKKRAKEMRKWDAQGRAILMTEGDEDALDFSSKSGAAANPGINGSGVGPEEEGDLTGWIDMKSLGKKGQDGTYELADVDDGGDDNDEEAEEEDVTRSRKPGGGFLSRFSAVSAGASSGTSASSGSSLFSRLTGSRALTKEDLRPALSAMQSHLQAKNVAANVASRLCDSVEKGLVGRQLGSFASVKDEVRKALEDSITRILTPKSSTDILLEIATKRERQQAAIANAAAAGAAISKGKGGANSNMALQADPYSICFVGVNGVGKSTNLAKVCFWLLQNRLKVLIAACDTFRSGAVEQLRVHVRNLGQLEVDGRKVSESASIELYERGYGKDAAGIAKDALAYAKSAGYDVVLIDTAGRMQDNEPLMRALAKLVAVNSPDKIIFVGEALVGNEAVDQLVKFDKSLKDFSGLSNPRGLDGMLLTKFDTIDDKVGTVLTAASVTGLPIFFVGVGQTYSDLRALRVRHILNALMRG